MDHDRQAAIQAYVARTKEAWNKDMRTMLQSRTPRTNSPAEIALEQLTREYHWELMDKNVHNWHLAAETDEMHRVVTVDLDESGLIKGWTSVTWAKRNGILEHTGSVHSQQLAEGLGDLLIEPLKELEPHAA